MTADKILTPKTVAQSRTILTNIVLPSETNHLGDMFGGELLSRMDRAGYIAATRHSERLTVTASVNNVFFAQPIAKGNIVIIEATVSRAFGSSMEVFIDVWIDFPERQERIKSNEAIYTFVAIDEDKKPVKIPELIPETALEKQRYQGALRRRQLSLVLAGRLKPSEATEIKKLFEEK